MSDWKSRAKPSGSWKDRAKPVSPDERMRRAQADESEPVEPSIEEQKAEFLPGMTPGAETLGVPAGDFARGVMSGFTMDADDEGMGALDAIDRAEYKTPEAPLADPLDAEPRHENSPLMAGFIDGGDSNKPRLVDKYRNAREMYGAEKDAARAASPKAYFAGQLVGAMGNPLGRAYKGGSLLASAGKTALSAGGYGALAGLGASKADLTRGEVGQALKDMGLSAGLSALTAGGSTLLAQPVSKGFNRLADYAKSKALEQVKKKALEGISAASGKLGSETQAASRALENVQRALENAEISPEAREKILQAVATPEAKALAEQVAVRSADKLGSQGAKIAAAEAALQPALQKATPEALKAAQAELLGRPEMSSRLWSIGKDMALPAAGMYLGNELGDALGMGVGGATGAMLSSLIRPGRRLNNAVRSPAFQNALGEVGSKAAMAVPGGVSSVAATPQAGDAMADYLRALRKEDEQP